MRSNFFLAFLSILSLLVINASIAFAGVVINGVEISDSGKIIYLDKTEQGTATAKGDTGPQGPQGPQGIQGPKGDSGLTYVRTILVSPVGTEQENGAALLAAMAGINDATSSKPYLFKIEPGIYDIQKNQLGMKQYVDIEGAGENTTIIQGSITNGYGFEYGVVNGANNAEIRLLTIKNTATASTAAAIVNNSTSPKLSHITIETQGATDAYGIHNYLCSPIMTNIAIKVSGSSHSVGIRNYVVGTLVPAMMNNIQVDTTSPSSNRGVLNENSIVQMNNISVNATGTSNLASNGGIDNQFTNITMNGVYVKSIGGSGAAGINNYTSFGTITNATIDISEAKNNNIGITNSYNTDPIVISNVVATISGGTYPIGINNLYSTPLLNNMVITVSTTSGTTVGINNQDSSPIISNVDVVAKNGTANYGMRNMIAQSPGIIRIDNSTVSGATNSVDSAPSYPVYIGSSKLSGGIPNADGTFKCYNVCNENYDALSNTCQPIP